MSRLQAQFLAVLPPALRAFIDGSSRRELLRKVNTTLLVFNNQVVHLESGRTAGFANDEYGLHPQQLAQASRSLLDQVHNETNKERCILLLLPPALFVATQARLPGISSDNIVSALSLQVESLLPANDSPVTLALNPGVAEISETPTALWLRNATMDDVFMAFEQQGLFVAAMKPRILNLSQEHTSYLDTDDVTVTQVTCQQNAMTRWLQTNRADLEQDAFARQWQESLTDDSGVSTIEIGTIDDYIALTENDSCQDYSFFPQGALSARKQVEKGRKIVLAAAVLVTALFLASIPFLIQSVHFRSLAATLGTQRELSFAARQDQAVVVNFENEFAPIRNFPEQHVRDAMFSLQNALAPNRLSSLELVKGQITIQGSSTEPQSILQKLEQDPMFTEVAFSRATNNDRYYIGLRLSTANFDAYMVRYFPDN